MKTWQAKDADARFSEFLDACLTECPQVVIWRGVETAVLLPIEQWRSLEQRARPTLKELLLAPAPRVENLTPARRSLRQ